MIFTKGLILGKLNYTLPLLGAEPEENLRSLDVCWRGALRVITGALMSTPIALLHAES